MALTSDEWFQRLKSWVPGWFFDSEGVQGALFRSIASGLNQVQSDSDELLSQTFISTASGNYLDLHGSERRITRNSGESDATYSSRVRIATNTATDPSMEQLIDGTLNNGVSQIIENKYYGFWDDELVYNVDSSRWIDGTKVINYMTVIVPIQNVTDTSSIRNSLNSTIEQNKALGVIFDIYFQT
jgi:hypothetical protein